MQDEEKQSKVEMSDIAIEAKLTDNGTATKPPLDGISFIPCKETYLFNDKKGCINNAFQKTEL